MKLFQRIFATFCAVIICAIFVASFSYWLIQNTIAENQLQKQSIIETSMMRSIVSAFKMRGEQGVLDILGEWEENPMAHKVFVVTGDEEKDILSRKVGEKMIKDARQFAIDNPDSDLVRIEFDRWGEEYLFFIGNWDNRQIKHLPSPLFIPGLHLKPIWHEFIILLFIILVGLLLAYILTNGIIKPVRVLSSGMSRLAAGDLETRVSQQMDDRSDEFSQLAEQFDKMAVKLQKLVAKERHLLHHVSHEMRSPLARMQAIVGLIQSQPQKQEQYLKRLESELARMDTMVGELLTLSRLETSNMVLEKDNLALVPFFTQLVEDSQAVAEQNSQNVVLEVGKVPGNAQLYANEGFLYRAFDNTIRNAMAYSPEGSTIKVFLSQDAKNWLIDITDNGPGVDEAQLPHIFTAFYRADSSAHKPGTGLGLAIAQHIVHQHSGKIMAENMRPNGLRVRFILPKHGK
ncbi:MULTISPECIES: ATP-binding protein [Neisseria]|uniref:histidine kinase n=1 Tax=Neisseria musculi TaxID=1815583 RepID=A0A7H1MD45_9NEIS|nr:MULTISPECIES: ATP-binding protein [Neisseria]MBF0804641.1 HAMP domain-containing protein [Neisseria sp. 19428wB4_WF04]QNT59560.1 histidine kinase-, DNA gyrase B-, and HSP90-like ATPase family protein [Neisseria musculi]TFU40341.1 HAMP domain-containing protein [Neisseria sp. WF04]